MKSLCHEVAAEFHCRFLFLTSHEHVDILALGFVSHRLTTPRSKISLSLNTIFENRILKANIGNIQPKIIPVLHEHLIDTWKWKNKATFDFQFNFWNAQKMMVYKKASNTTQYMRGTVNWGQRPVESITRVGTP